MANVVIIGAQWGDEGKGKIIDILSKDVDYVVRYQGGNNAGHTVVIGDGADDRTIGKNAEGKTVEQAEADGESLGLERYQAFYRASSRVPTERHTVPLIDGACGFGSVERIVNALGYELEYIHQTAKEVVYTLDRING